MALLLRLAGLTAALIVHAVAAPVFFVVLGRRYFRARGARDPLPTAVAWTSIAMLFDLVVVAGGLQHSLRMFRSVAGTWLPFALIFLASWATGELMSTMPWPTDKKGRRPRPPVSRHGRRPRTAPPGALDPPQPVAPYRRRPPA